MINEFSSLRDVMICFNGNQTTLTQFLIDNEFDIDTDLLRKILFMSIGSSFKFNNGASGIDTFERLEDLDNTEPFIETKQWQNLEIGLKTSCHLKRLQTLHLDFSNMLNRSTNQDGANHLFPCLGNWFCIVPGYTEKNEIKKIFN